MGTWYHGSRQRLSTLRAGSSITQNRDVAKAFSHRPSLVSMSQSEDGDEWSVRHDGATPGFLYVVAEEIRVGDVRPHPHPVNVSRWEWLTNRDMSLTLIEETDVTDGERLTDEEIAELRKKQEERGEESFAESSDAAQGERLLSTWGRSSTT